MLVEREHAIRAFVPRDYWEVQRRLAPPTAPRSPARWRSDKPTRLASAALADAIVARDHGARRSAAGRSSASRAKTVREPPPQLFDLTSLQRTANRRFGFSAQRTLELAQALYERHKLLTYPRTDSRHLSTRRRGRAARRSRRSPTLPEYARVRAARSSRTPPRPSRRDRRRQQGPAITTRSSRPATDPPRGARSRRSAALRSDRAALPRRVLSRRRVRGDRGVDARRRGRAAAPPEPSRRADREQYLDALPPPPDRYLARGRVRLVAGWQEVAGHRSPRARSAPATQSDDERREREPTGALPRARRGPAPRRHVRGAREADHAAAALHRGDAARRDGVRGQVDRRRGAARRDEGHRARHAGDARRRSSRRCCAATTSRATGSSSCRRRRASA